MTPRHDHDDEAPPRAAAPPPTRLAKALATADAEVVRALKLAGVTDESQLRRLADVQLLRLPRVGKNTIRKIHSLMIALGLREGARPAPVRVLVTLELTPAQQERLATLAKASGARPAQWLRQVLLDAIGADNGVRNPQQAL